MWDEEDGFFYDVLRLPDGQAQRLKVRSMVGLLPLCAATVFDGELLAKYPELGERFQWFLEARPELRAAIHDPRKVGVAGRRLACRPGRNQAPPRAGQDARRERVPQPLRHPLAVALPRRPSLRLPRRRPGVPRLLPAGRVRHRHVRRQLELARADLDAGQRPDHPGLAAVLRLLRRRLHRRMPHRLRPADEPVPGGRGDRAPAGRTSSCKDKDGRRPVYGGAREVPGRSALARLPAVLRVLPRRQRRRPRRQPPDRLDGNRRPDDAPVRGRETGGGPASRQGDRPEAGPTTNRLAEKCAGPRSLSGVSTRDRTTNKEY